MISKKTHSVNYKKKLSKSKAISEVFARRLVKKPTKAEVILLECLRPAIEGLGFKLIFQEPYHSYHRFYILDFYIPSVKLCIEIDGGYHNTEEQILRDRVRDLGLQDIGIKTIRFNNKEVMADPFDIANKICTIVIERQEQSCKRKSTMRKPNKPL